jgi:hypothetical protein
LKKNIQEENLSPFEDEMLEEEEINKKSQTPAAENDAINLDEKQSSSLTNHYWNPGEIAQLRAKLLSPTKRRFYSYIMEWKIKSIFSFKGKWMN